MSLKREAVLKEYEREIIRDIGIRVECRKGQALFSVGQTAENVYLLESGLVVIDDGTGEGLHSKAGSMRGPGELVGLDEALRGALRTSRAVAISDVVLFSVEKKDFQGLLTCDPFLFSRIIKICNYRNQRPVLS
jgi:CRP-like cAMP-binding protein